MIKFVQVSPYDPANFLASPIEPEATLTATGTKHIPGHTGELPHYSVYLEGNVIENLSIIDVLLVFSVSSLRQGNSKTKQNPILLLLLLSRFSRVRLCATP